VDQPDRRFEQGFLSFSKHTKPNDRLDRTRIRPGGRGPGRRPGQGGATAPRPAQAEWRGWTIASWAAFTGESGGCPVSTRTTSCAAKSRTVRIASSELYDVDRPINRTLVYGLLTALLAGVYAGAVLVLGQVFGGVTDDPPSWAVAGATLAVAALFQPARRRIQTVVDRRFNRRKYNAARTVELFAVRLRNEVDLDTLSAELLGVVDQTMQPTRSSLWLRPTSPASRRTAGWNRVNVWSYGAAM
jgi:hypothetical protein